MSATTFCPVSAQDYQQQISRWIAAFNVHTNNWPTNRTFISYTPLSNTAILKARYGTDIEIRKTRNTKYYVFHIPLAGPFICYLNGKKKIIEPGQGFLVYPGMDVELVFPKDSETLVLRIDESFFLDNLAMLGGELNTASYSPEGYSLDMSSHAGQLLKQAMDYFQIEAWSSTRLIEYPGFISHLESVISCRIIAALGLVNTYRETGNKHNDHAQQIVREAEHYMTTNMKNHMSTTQIADYCGVSYRTLQRVFVSVHGISPLKWLKQQRLQGVRSQLIGPRSSQDISVTAVAMDWGFSDLGRFAGLYRDYFGELPRETLRTGRKVSDTFLR